METGVGVGVGERLQADFPQKPSGLLSKPVELCQKRGLQSHLLAVLGMSQLEENGQFWLMVSLEFTRLLAEVLVDAYDSGGPVFPTFYHSGQEKNEQETPAPPPPFV